MRGSAASTPQLSCSSDTDVSFWAPTRAPLISTRPLDKPSRTPHSISSVAAEDACWLRMRSAAAAAADADKSPLPPATEYAGTVAAAAAPAATPADAPPTAGAAAAPGRLPGGATAAAAAVPTPASSMTSVSSALARDLR